MILSRRIENYWNERSENFSRSRRLELEGADGSAWRNIFKKNLPKGKLKILDVGTGAGFFAMILAEMGLKTVIKNLNKVAKKYTGVKITEGGQRKPQ